MKRICLLCGWNSAGGNNKEETYFFTFIFININTNYLRSLLKRFFFKLPETSHTIYFLKTWALAQNISKLRKSQSSCTLTVCCNCLPLALTRVMSDPITKCSDHMEEVVLGPIQRPFIQLTFCKYTWKHTVWFPFDSLLYKWHVRALLPAKINSKCLWTPCLFQLISPFN